jgi:hypothetical protein
MQRLGHTVPRANSKPAAARPIARAITVAIAIAIAVSIASASCACHDWHQPLCKHRRQPVASRDGPAAAGKHRTSEREAACLLCNGRSWTVCMVVLHIAHCHEPSTPS